MIPIETDLDADPEIFKSSKNIYNSQYILFIASINCIPESLQLLDSIMLSAQNSTQMLTIKTQNLPQARKHKTEHLIPNKINRKMYSCLSAPSNIISLTNIPKNYTQLSTKKDLEDDFIQQKTTSSLIIQQTDSIIESDVCEKQNAKFGETKKVPRIFNQVKQKKFYLPPMQEYYVKTKNDPSMCIQRSRHANSRNKETNETEQDLFEFNVPQYKQSPCKQKKQPTIIEQTAQTNNKVVPEQQCQQSGCRITSLRSEQRVMLLCFLLITSVLLLFRILY